MRGEGLARRPGVPTEGLTHRARDGGIILEAHVAKLVHRRVARADPTQGLPYQDRSSPFSMPSYLCVKGRGWTAISRGPPGSNIPQF